MADRRFLGYSIRAWRVKDQGWFAWLVTPEGVHMFVKGASFPEVQECANAAIMSDLSKREEEGKPNVKLHS